MRFVGDFHLHSRFSRATSPTLDLMSLHAWAQRKGIGLLGTGDCTHPEWLAELRSSLVPAGDGVFKLRDDLARQAEATVDVRDRTDVRFLLTGEISNIYRDRDRTRKVHTVLYAPSFEAVEGINDALGQRGNLAADGRPILGMSVRDLLEIVLERGAVGCDAAFLVPAHIWTPWFSVLGAKSGHDSVVECFGDLASHVFALETGLSADPSMCRRVSALDRFALVSNSDAHSGSKLGREASVFDTECDFPSIRSAWEERDATRFVGTIEFFPEEGKYHYDGHRKCGVRVSPREALGMDGICPLCGKPMTRGVASRIEELADRASVNADESFEMLMPLAEIVAEVAQVGPGTKRVATVIAELERACGGELDVLRRVDLADIERASSTAIAEAVRRVRAREVIVEPGYDGVFGTVRIFSDGERAHWLARGNVFAVGAGRSPTVAAPADAGPSGLGDLAAEGTRVVEGETSFAIIGGPGTGKSALLARAIERGIRRERQVLVLVPHAPAEQVLRRRLRQLDLEPTRRLHVRTFDAVPSGPFGEFDLVVVDDAQDVARAHAKPVRRCVERAPISIVAGDPDQATISIPSSGPPFFIDFTNRRDVQTLRLTRSFRLPEDVITAAQAIIGRAQIRWETRLWSGLATDRAVVRETMTSPRAEANTVAKHVGSLLASSNRPQDVAVLCRTPDRVEVIAQALHREGVVTKRLTDAPACRRPEVHRLASRLQQLGANSNVRAAERVAMAAADSPLARTLVRLAEPFGRELDRFAHALQSATDRALFDVEIPAVTVGTFAASGAMEFSIVFLAGLEADVVPDPEVVERRGVDDERRTFYLALTRARRQLYLTRALKKSIVGRRVQASPSPFWTEIHGREEDWSVDASSPASTA